MTEPIDVQGGAYGIVADAQALLGAAGTLRDCGYTLLESAARSQLLLLEPALSTASLLDPGGALRFEATLAQALDGGGGLLGQATMIEALGLAVAAAAIAYETADQVNTALCGLPSAILHGSYDQLAQAGEELAVGGIEGLLSPALALFTASQLLADGDAAVTNTGPDPGVDRAGPPRDIADVLTGLGRRSAGGDIDVRILTTTSPSGVVTRHVIVDIPGTDNWSPSEGNADVTNLGTNVLAIQGARTSYENGVIQAMRQAGVRATDDVMLVGHSQGGMVAITTAKDVTASGEFHVSHVITAGSPVGLTSGQVPSSVSVLAIENGTDIVPKLDGATNPDRPNVLTVTVHHDHSSIGDSHSVEKSYVPGARDIDANASGNRSLQAYLNSLDGFFGADSVSTETFHVARKS